MSSRAAFQEKLFRFRRSVHLLGSGLCSLLVLVACGQRERQFNPSGAGGAAGGGGTDTTGPGGGGSDATGPGGGGSDASSSSSAGGGTPCETRDPDCECADGQVVARDVDGDGEGSQLCETAPGRDCDDGDEAFVQNPCGGCNKSLGGNLGDACGVCGVLQCLGDSAVQCAAPDPTPRRCSGSSTVQVCAGGQWTTEKTCDGEFPVCLEGVCKQCRPGTFKCGEANGTPVVIKCLDTGSWESSWSVSCSSSQTCNAASGTCAGLFHPRDIDFDVPQVPGGAPAAPAGPGMPTRDVLDLVVGIAFA